MNIFNIAYGFLSGVLSCLTPEALLLVPLLVAAAGAATRRRVIALAVGLGLALILTGALAASIGQVLRLEAVWLRRFMDFLLILAAIALMGREMADRYPVLTGGSGGYTTRGAIFRVLLLALFVGANWVPEPGPTLGKASLMAADAENVALTFGVLFAFGVGAAVPWIVVGRLFRLILRGVAPGLLDGIAGKRILGFTLLVVAILGISGLDATVARRLNPMLPNWAHKYAMMF